MGWLDSLFPTRSGGVPSGVPAPDRDRQLVLFGHDYCGYCVRVNRALERLGVEVEQRNLLVDPAHRQQLRARTSRTQVPCLFIDDVPLFESLDIIAWLEAYAVRGQKLAG